MIVDPDFLDHWKTRVLVDMLGGDELAPVYVIRLWAHCQNRKQSVFHLEKPNGNPTVNPAVTQRKPIVNHALKALCKYAGEAEKFVDSLVSAGFVEITSDGGGFEVVGWSRHNAQLVAAWENGARGGRPAKKPTGNPTVTHGKPNANPSETDKRREEKSREEKNEKPPKPPEGESVKSQVDCVASYYLSIHTRARVGERERKLISARLKEGFSVEDLKQAIDGNHKSDYHSGVNETGKKYHGIGLIFRNAEKVSGFIESAEGVDVRRGPAIPTLAQVQEAYGHVKE